MTLLGHMLLAFDSFSGVMYTCNAECIPTTEVEAIYMWAHLTLIAVYTLDGRGLVRPRAEGIHKA